MSTMKVGASRLRISSRLLFQLLSSLCPSESSRSKIVLDDPDLALSYPLQRILQVQFAHLRKNFRAHLGSPSEDAARSKRRLARRIAHHFPAPRADGNDHRCAHARRCVSCTRPARGRNSNRIVRPSGGGLIEQPRFARGGASVRFIGATNIQREASLGQG
jgi:hypothetical protein